MVLTPQFQNRLCALSKEGAKQVTIEVLVALLAVPVAIRIAAINAYTCCIMFASALAIVGYGMSYARRKSQLNQFFFVWLSWSLIIIIYVYEAYVPFYKLLPEENLILVLLTSSAIFFMCRTKRLARLNQSSVAENEQSELSEISRSEKKEASQTALLIEPDKCSTCRQFVFPRTSHCSVCCACIKVRDHHSYWLNCCIGQFNHLSYVLCLLLSTLALLLCWNLTLTAVCHPFLVVRVLSVPIMLPDDCSEVFDNQELSLCFVVASYLLLIAAYILIVLSRQIYKISMGKTSEEQRHGHIVKRKSIWTNWRTFIFSI